MFLWWIYGGALFIVALIHALVMNNTFHIAVRKGKYGELNELLNNGTDINGVDRGGQTPLYIAVKQNDPKMVKYLLDRGAREDAVVGLDMSLAEFAQHNGYGKAYAVLASRKERDPHVVETSLSADGI